MAVNLPALPTSGSMSLASAIALLREFARMAGSSASYSDLNCQHAIEGACSYFCRETKYVTASGTITVAGGTDAVDASGLSLFRPERILSVSAEDVDEPLKKLDPLTMHAKRNAAQSGLPEFISFHTATAGYVYPAPADDCDLTVRYWQPWDTTSMNLPLEVLREIIPTGAAAMLQHNEPEALYASGAWQKFLAIVEQYKGVDGNFIQMPCEA